jgi:uncharacterized protein (TIGR01244 family)
MRRRTLAGLGAILMAMALSPGMVVAQEDFGIAGARLPAEGLLFGGQLTAEQLGAVDAAGYRVVIDLRAASEDRGYDEAAEAARLGLEYVNIPVDGAALERDETYERFFAALDGTKPLVAHCGSGNRVGGLYYAYLVAKRGLPRDQALEQARQSGLRSDALAKTVDRWLDRRPTP